MEFSTHNPLVSCLCITHKRPEFLKTAIECFEAQNYSNKELIIVHNTQDFATINLLRNISNKNIKPIPLETNGIKISIGELRNIAISQAQGDYLCTWDDDDWYHADRIKYQLESIQISKKRACVLSQVLIFDRSSDKTYLSFSRLWENSLFFERKILSDFDIQYRHISRAEDYYFVNRLIELNLLYPLLNPMLYIYHATDINTCGRSHFDYLIEKSILLSTYQNLIVQKIAHKLFSAKAASEKISSSNFSGKLPLIPAPFNEDAGWRI